MYGGDAESVGLVPKCCPGSNNEVAEAKLVNAGDTLAGLPTSVYVP
jgi:hypothetical protein